MKVKSMRVALLIVSVIASAATFAANKQDSSDFYLKIFNSTKGNQLQHYTVIRKGQSSIVGEITSGGESDVITVQDLGSPGESQAEIIVKDAKGHTLWDSVVKFWGTPDFYTDTISLDSHYHASTHAYPSTHMVAFDIQDS